LASKNELPRLVRRLILETGEGVTTPDFPASEGTASKDWDGVVQASADAPFVPAGLSLWELSAGRSTTKKADEDYAKRPATPDGSATQDATYCQLIVRRWTTRRTWAKTRVADGRWRTVRAFGVDELETWIESAPVTHAWLSELLGLSPYGMRTPTAWWEAWASATEPRLTPEVLLAGRTHAIDALSTRLRENPALTTLRAESQTDALAFIASLMLRDDRDGEGALATRTLFVDHVETWRTLADHGRPLVLVPLTSDVVVEARAASKHHVIVPVVGTAVADITLESIGAAEALKSLEALGIDASRADEAARIGRRSVVALRRRFATQPELHAPPWAKPPVERVVRGVLLAGSWNDDSQADQEQLVALTGTTYDELRELLDGLAAEADPLVMLVDRTWAVVSSFDAWRELRVHIRPDDLERFRVAVMDVVLEDDPSFQLSAEEKWRASIDGKVRSHSADLRAGLATSIALLGVFGEDVKLRHGRSGVAFASSLVAQLLASANDRKDGGRWAALSDNLPFLAEGAPDAFLNAVLAGSAGDEPVLRRVFSDGDTTNALFGAHSPHSALLWALERLAWSPQYFAQTIYALARLVDVDSGGRLMNRPPNTLAGIFCPWHPETAATKEQQMSVLDELRRRYPKVAWQLLTALLPEPHATHSLNAGPRFQDWKPTKIEVSVQEFHQLIAQIVEWLIQDAGADPSRWQTLIEKSARVSPSSRAKIREELADRLERDELSKPGRLELWTSIRHLVARHRQFVDADWALPPEELAAFETLETALVPTDPIDRTAWLFTEHMPDLGDASKLKDGTYDHDGYTKALTDRRRLAVAGVFSADGLDGALDLAARAVVPGAVGDALAQIDEGSCMSACLELLTSDDASKSALAGSYVARRLSNQDPELLDSLMAAATLSDAQKARILLLIRDYEKVWPLVDRLGAEVADYYWKRFSPLGLGGDFEQVDDATRRLLAVSRPAAALHLLVMYTMRGDGDGDRVEYVPLVADTLEDLLACDPDDLELRSLQEYDYESAFSFLERNRDAVGTERLASLEWAFLPALGYDRDAPTLEGALGRDPASFVDVLSTIYRPYSGPERDLSEEQMRVGTNASRLLSSWRRPPGTSRDGSFDARALDSWIDTVLPLLDGVDRRAVGEIHIGNVLAFAPADPEGTWPCVGVRDLLERVQLQDLEQGLRTQIYNNRGATVRSPEAGGEQERDLVRRYRDDAAKFVDRWPRTAAVLRALADSFESDAGMYETEAERRRRGLDP